MWNRPCLGTSATHASSSLAGSEHGLLLLKFEDDPFQVVRVVTF